MQSKKLAGSKAGPSVQKYLDFAEIKNDVVVMKDGTLRSILMVSSINFALKSEDEQNAIIQQYISFMNALDYPIQIVVQSRQLNVDDYLERLMKAEREQENDLLRIQIADYRAFVAELVEMGQIMNKQFFVIVPYNPLSDKRKNFWSRLSEVLSPALSVKLAEERFQKRRDDLLMRVRSIESNLGSMGLKAIMLNTQQLIELYYRAYNPELIDTEKLEDINEVRTSENSTVT
ncbi:TraC family protein [Patescibacteria group bacterium]|nr:TraC family protein [Patescibacteria group bacterium]MBU1029576.1 TraC family protein [Patescibacteria group bacterium]MBU1916080.1 TraC family protein [Patescibacteria group bacterium]